MKSYLNDLQEIEDTCNCFRFGKDNARVNDIEIVKMLNMTIHSQWLLLRKEHSTSTATSTTPEIKE
jgi:hypothetical protein